MSNLDRPSAAPSWMVTFADLMALLVTFFVLLFSFSQVDVKKYNALMDSIKKALGVQLIQASVVAPGPQPGIISPHDREHEVIHHDIDAQLAKEINQKMISTRHDNGRIVIQFQDNVAFFSGSAELNQEFLPVISKLSATLEKHNAEIGEIMVAGHTDNLPIKTTLYRSNWELSTARAVTVIDALLKHGNIDPDKLFAAGFADTHPLVANDSEENRSMNRRVEIHLFEKHAEHKTVHQRH